MDETNLRLDEIAQRFEEQGNQTRHVKPVSKRLYMIAASMYLDSGKPKNALDCIREAGYRHKK